MTTSARLTILSGSLSGLVFELHAERYVVGRLELCDICIPDSTMSSRHGVLVRLGDGGYEVQDQGSTNGSRINGARISTGKLVNRDILQLGSVELRYDCAADPAATSAGDTAAIGLSASGALPPGAEVKLQVRTRMEIPALRGPGFGSGPGAVVVPARQNPGMIIDAQEFREALHRAVKGGIGLAAVIVLKCIIGFFWKRSSHWESLRLSDWVQMLLTLVLVGFLIRLYQPVKALVAFYLAALVKAGKLPGRDKYLGNFLAVAQRLTLLLFAVVVYGFLLPVISQGNDSFLHFRYLITIFNVCAFLAVAGILFLLWKEDGRLLFDLLTGHITDRVSTLSSNLAYATCPACHDQNDLDADFCISCGIPMKQKADHPPAAPVMAGPAPTPDLPPTLPENPALSLRQQAAPSSPSMFLYIPVWRFVLMHVLTMGIFGAYWIYKNWRYLKERDGLTIRPVWRGIFGVFYCYGILKAIRDDKPANALEPATFSAGGLATGWIIFAILGNQAAKQARNVTESFAAIVICLLPLFFLKPVQKYLNRANEKLSPRPAFAPWSTGQAVVLVIGVLLWALEFWVLSRY